MAYRALYGALIATLLFAPLSLALCEHCSADRCPPETVSAPVEQGVDGHCAQMAPAEERAPADAATALETSDCCVVAADLQVSTVAATAGSAGLFAVAPAAAVDAPAPGTSDRVDGTAEPPRRPPRHLYTLHSSLLL